MTREESRRSIVSDRRLSHLAVRVWFVLDQATGDRVVLNKRQKEIADVLGVSTREVRRCIVELETVGVLISRRRHKSCDYILEASAA